VCVCGGVHTGPMLRRDVKGSIPQSISRVVEKLGRGVGFEDLGEEGGVVAAGGLEEKFLGGSALRVGSTSVSFIVMRKGGGGGRGGDGCTSSSGCGVAVLDFDMMGIVEMRGWRGKAGWVGRKREMRMRLPTNRKECPSCKRTVGCRGKPRAAAATAAGRRRRDRAGRHWQKPR
jgi:hypothetical protein